MRRVQPGPNLVPVLAEVGGLRVQEELLQRLIEFANDLLFGYLSPWKTTPDTFPLHLVDDLLFRGYKNITVLDISRTAMEVTKKRLGSSAEQVHWVAGDVTYSPTTWLSFTYDISIPVQNDFPRRPATQYARRFPAPQSSLHRDG
jgi:hypothetical protein